jgi:hypothetical protein
VKGKWQTKYGLDEISMTARERAFMRQRKVVSASLQIHNVTTTTYLIQGCIRRSVSLDTPSLTQSLLERIPQRNRAVFRRVVVVDPEIALALEFKGHASVLGQCSQHLSADERTNVRIGSKDRGKRCSTYVVQEAETGRDFDLLHARGIVEGQGAGDAGFRGFSRDGGGSNGHDDGVMSDIYGNGVRQNLT